MSSAHSPLDTYTLVLNRNWLAIGVTTVRHAMSLIFGDTARAIHPETFEIHDFDSWSDLGVADGEPCIRTVSLKIKVPEIIVLRIFDGLPRRRVVFSRRNIFRRDQYMCQYCGAKPGSGALTIDHLVPRSRGGKSTWGNCVLACLRCNTKKGNRPLVEAGMRLLKQPSEPAWIPYFSIPITQRRISWEKFVSDRYWDAQLER
jgi:5-methylcytosine-specific restriction endonuclease McrA